MKDIFVSLLNMSLAPSLLIAAAVLVRLFKGVPKKARCVLWGFAALRLIFPFSVESIFSLLPQKEVTAEILETVPVINTVISNAPENITFTDRTVPLSSESLPFSDILGIISAVWLAGAIFMLLYMTVSLVRVHISVREAVKRDNFYLCDRISGAFVLGIFRPRIYIPSALEDKKEYIIAHELAHIRRLDHIWKPISFLLLSVYWFNPLCWLGCILFCRDIELACDEMAIKNYDLKHKKAYSETLLEANIRSGYPISFGGSGIRERVKNVFNYKKTTIWAAAASAVLCGVIAVCFLTDPVSSENNPVNNIEETNNISGENTSQFIPEPVETATEAALTEETEAAEEADTIVSTAETPEIGSGLLTPEEIEDLDEEVKARLGYVADAEGNILAYVPEVITDNMEIPQTDVKPEDTDIILESLLEIKAVADEAGYKEFQTKHGLTVVTSPSGKYVMFYLPAEKGTEAYALQDGIVLEADYSPGLGYSVTVESGDGSHILYSHLDGFAVEAGDTVVKGQLVGYAGSTGMASYSQIRYALE